MRTRNRLLFGLLCLWGQMPAEATLPFDDRCELSSLAPPPYGDRMYLYYLSLHHGILASNTEFMTELDGLVSAKTLKRLLKHRVTDSVLVFTSASCVLPFKVDNSGAPLGFTGHPDVFYRNEFGDRLRWAESFACGIPSLGRHNRQVIAVGSNFSIRSTQTFGIPNGINTPSSTEYAVFVVQHKKTGREFSIFAVYVGENNGSPGKLDQIEFFVGKAKEAAAERDTFVGGDLNVVDADDQFVEHRGLWRNGAVFNTMGSIEGGTACKTGGAAYTYRVLQTEIESGKVHLTSFSKRQLEVTAAMLNPQRPKLVPTTGAIYVAAEASDAIHGHTRAGLAHSAVGVEVRMSVCSPEQQRCGQHCVVLGTASDCRKCGDKCLAPNRCDPTRGGCVRCAPKCEAGRCGQSDECGSICGCDGGYTCLQGRCRVQGGHCPKAGERPCHCAGNACMSMTSCEAACGQ